MYHYAGNNPVKYVDPDGNFVETAWDVFSLVTGVASLVADVKEGNVKGAGAAIKAARITGSVTGVLQAGSGVG